MLTPAVVDEFPGVETLARVRQRASDESNGRAGVRAVGRSDAQGLTMRRLGVFAVAGLASLLVSLPAYAGATGATGVVRISPSGVSELPADVSIMSWSGNAVLYQEQRQSTAFPKSYAAASMARTARSFAVSPPAAEVPVDHARWVAGDLVTGVSDGRLYFVHADGAGAGSRELPADVDEVVTGSPDGVLYVKYDRHTGSEHVYDFKAADGSVADLGGLPHSSGFCVGDEPPCGFVDGDSDGAGLVLAYFGHVEYMSFALPGVFTDLDSAGMDYGAHLALGSTAAAWSTYDSAHVVRSPLNGSAATTYETNAANAGAPIAGVAVLPTMTGWVLDKYDFEQDHYHFFSAPAGGGAPTEWSRELAPSASFSWPYERARTLVGATDTAFVVVVAGPAGSEELVEIPSARATTSTVIAHIQPSPVSAGAVAIGPGRVAWSDDSQSTLPVWDANVSGGGDDVSVGQRTELASHSSRIAEVSVSGRRTSYLAPGSGPEFASLWLSDGQGRSQRVAVSASDYPAPPQLSGTRLLYATQSDASPYKWFLRDLTSGRTTQLADAAHGTGVTAYALWGDYLAYALNDGSIWRRDLSRDNADVEISGSGLPVTQLAVAGDSVAWRAKDCGRDDCIAVFRYRTVGAGSATNDIDVNPLSVGSFALTPSYLVFGAMDDATQTWRLDAVDVAADSSRPIPVTTAQLNPGALDIARVAANGSQVAWVSPSDGAARVASLAHVPERPWLLGSPIAPASFNAQTNAWNAEFVTSLALPNCTLTITSGHTLVRTFDCGSNAGDAQVRWDGTDSAGVAVPRGRYTWTLTGANADGALRASDGSSRPITGIIRVQRPATPVHLPPPAGNASGVPSGPFGILPATGPIGLRTLTHWALLLIMIGTGLCAAAARPAPRGPAPVLTHARADQSNARARTASPRRHLLRTLFLRAFLGHPRAPPTLTALYSGGQRNTSAIFSAGESQSRVLRGRRLSFAATRSRSAWLIAASDVRFGKYWRSRPLVFSLVPRCQGERGSQK
jgi:hypothetical protein